MVFLGLIWISQILRILDFQYSLTNQIFDIAGSTLLILPSFINHLVPFIILISSFIVNTKITKSNEVIILKQYLSASQLKVLLHMMIFLIFLIFTLNNELISKKFYKEYKIQELDIRNNLKLGSPTKHEFHIDDVVSIFFKKNIDNIFFETEAIIYKENQLIVSESLLIELSKSNFNLVFLNGERLILSDNEKSRTVFDKFTYVLEGKKYEKLLMDKDHYNTYELILHSQKDFRNFGHSRIFQYFFLLFISLICIKIIFYFNNKINIYKFTFIFLLVIIIQIINTYTVYLLNNIDTFRLIYFYLINFIFLILSLYLSNKTLK